MLFTHPIVFLERDASYAKDRWHHNIIRYHNIIRHHNVIRYQNDGRHQNVIPAKITTSFHTKTWSAIWSILVGLQAIESEINQDRFLRCSEIYEGVSRVLERLKPPVPKPILEVTSNNRQME